MGSRWVFAAIFFLTVVDLVCTYFGLQSGKISEGNPLMAFLLDRYRIYSYCAVLAGVAASLFFLYRVRARVKWLPIAVNLVLVVKASVILLHFIWIINT